VKSQATEILAMDGGHMAARMPCSRHLDSGFTLGKAAIGG
jgi:hypothetical protein